MAGEQDQSNAPCQPQCAFLSRLVHDHSGNTLALVAASIAPLLALIGGGIDMSRGYLSQVRLQQACDSGVLAARKKLGTAVVVDGVVPDAVADVGNRFFDLNFADGAYGSENRSFEMSLEDDYAISGIATVAVPTTIMAIFGSEQMEIAVKCEARINYSDMDIMFVLDTTGSMNGTNPGDTVSRIDAMRDVVADFYTQIEESKSPDTRVRYGFVPYSTNVNVGHLLEDDWVVSEWTYQSRVKVKDLKSTQSSTSTTNWKTISGTYSTQDIATYDATFRSSSSANKGYGEGSVDSGQGRWTCDGGSPSSTTNATDTLLSTQSEPYLGPPSGTKTTEHFRRLTNGDQYWTSITGNKCTLHKRTYVNFLQEFDRVTIPVAEEKWLYKPVTIDVSDWRDKSNGCVEERATYEIYSMDETVDFDRALDLNIDAIPTPGIPDTQWRPMYPNIIYERALTAGKLDAFSVEEVLYKGDYFKPRDHEALVACPQPAMRLAELTKGEFSGYLKKLKPSGQTYHDIGMIWGGRLLSPTGLFEADNADRSGKTTSRHLIFLTDGQTEPLDIAYGAYGVEPLDLRRWTERDDPLLDRTIELRFGIACNEVKKRNVTVWVIGFGTAMNDVMMECAGDGHWFLADDAEELSETFNQIAKSMAELRISK